MIRNKYTQENPRINQQDRQKIAFPGSANLRRSLNSVLLLHTQKQCTARGSARRFSSLSLTTHDFWIHLWGEGRQASRQLSDASTPWCIHNKEQFLLPYTSVCQRTCGFVQYHVWYLPRILPISILLADNIWSVVFE